MDHPISPSTVDQARIEALAIDRCPRCGGGFHCGVNDPGPCACSTLSLSAALQAELRRRYSGCLCLRCLHELAAAEGGEPPA